MLISNKFVIFLIITVLSVNGIEREMTINIQAGKEDCFYQYVKEHEKIDIEYQVIDGGHGNLDITFHLVDPTGRILAADYKKSENNHRADARMSGDYKFCFDNTFSSYNQKTVFFELIVEGEDDEYWDPAEAAPEEIYEVTVEEINSAIARIKVNVNTIKHLQDLIKSTEARDRNIAEENYFKVNTFSMMQILVMVFVSFVQVVMVRSLFDDKSRVHGIWKKLQSSR